MHVVREPVALAIIQGSEKGRRIIVNRLASKFDDHRPWYKETPLLDKENREEQDKSLSPRRLLY
jgi:hypothetical protein